MPGNGEGRNPTLEIGKRRQNRICWVHDAAVDIALGLKRKKAPHRVEHYQTNRKMSDKLVAPLLWWWDQTSNQNG